MNWNKLNETEESSHVPASINRTFFIQLEVGLNKNFLTQQHRFIKEGAKQIFWEGRFGVFFIGLFKYFIT